MTLRAMSPISVRPTDEALSSDASSLSVYIQSRESLSAEPSVLHQESIADTDSVILTHPPGYTITRINTPVEEEAYQGHENTSAPHPHLIYDVQRTNTSYETLALCNTARNTLYAPQTFQPQVQVHPTQDDSSLPPRILETPPPPGFEFNRAEHHIPFPIRLADGSVRNARYTQLIMAADPFVLGIATDDPRQFGQPVYAILDYDQSEMPRYTHQELLTLLAPEEDDKVMAKALKRVNNKML